MKSKIIVCVSIIVVVALMGFVIIFMGSNEPNVNYTEDEIKFKDEYESVNGIEVYDNYTLKTIDIENDNNVVYVKDDDILKLLSEGSNVIYFGWSECNWCRSVVPTLISSLKENNIDNLYYYNFKNLRNMYENNDEQAVSLYEDILNIIGEGIESVFDENSTKAGNKKILAPTVVFIKNGEFLGLHVKSVNSHINSSDELDTNQIKELKNIYQKYLDQININVCVEDGC